MDRCGVFVDAGYLIAEGAKAFVAPGAKRGDVLIDHSSLVQRLRDRAARDSGLPVLRVYWYDGAVDGVPTTDQQEIASLPFVKLRLGRISGGRQKGVDALVYRDLSVLARERAVATAFVLAGDEDLREGVSMAQELGVQVTLWGLGSAKSQARTLMSEVDTCEILDDVQDLFTPAPGSHLALTKAPSPASAVPTEGAVRTAAEEFARTWAARALSQDLGDLLAVEPHIPAALDAELLRALQAAHGDLRAHPVLRARARTAFWDAVRVTPTGG